MAEQRNTILLSSKQYVHVQDGSDGHIYVFNGPGKCTPQDNDILVSYDPISGQFRPSDPNKAIHKHIYAKEGQYVILYNPTKGDQNNFPKKGQQDSIDLSIGTKIILPGPIEFGLWPGQYAEVIEGHSLLINEWLLLYVINGKIAQNNWKNAIIEKPEKEKVKEIAKLEDKSEKTLSGKEEIPFFQSGQFYIIKGTEVSFFMPSSGMEAIKDDNDKYIRQATTLQQLEYCVLLDRNGTKEYVYGPAVVFPKPTQQLLEKQGKTKFRAIELDENWGLHIKVTENYSEKIDLEESFSKNFKEGEELFITGKDSKIYWPKKEHSFITYGDKNEIIHYGIAIPDGQARYVLNRKTGNISLQPGPTIFLPDPREQVIVTRKLPEEMTKLMYPGNKEALMANQIREDQMMKEPSSRTVKGALYYSDTVSFSNKTISVEDINESFTRKAEFTPPRTIDLQKSKYEGAIGITIWSGYAVRIINNADPTKNRTEIGEKPILLEYTESLDVLKFSTGTPKKDNYKQKDVYLQIKGNVISDEVNAVTKDFIQIKIPVQYRVNFLEKDKDNWFSIKDPVGFLTIHMRSVIRNIVKEFTISSFSSDYINILRRRTLIKNKKKTGVFFPENGMHIYDMAIDEIEIEDNDISEQILQHQREVIETTLSIDKEYNDYKEIEEKEKIKQQLDCLKTETKKLIIDNSIKNNKKEIELLDSTILFNEKSAEEKKKESEADQNLTDFISTAILHRRRTEEYQKLEILKDLNEEKREMLKAEVNAIKDKASAINDKLATTLGELSKNDLIEKISENLGNLSVLEGGSLVMTLKNLLKGSGLDDILNKIKGE